MLLPQMYIVGVRWCNSDWVSGAARNFVREGLVTDVVRFQTLAIFHKDHFDVTRQFLVYYNRI